MTTTIPSPDPPAVPSAMSGEPTAPPSSPQPHHRLVTLPTGKMLGAVIAVGVGVAVLGWAVARFVRPVAMDAVWLGGPPAAFVVGLGVLVAKPWKPRRVMDWPMAMFGIQGATLFAAGVVAAVIYSQTRPDAIGFSLALMVTFMGS